MKNGFFKKLAAGVISGLMCLMSIPGLPNAQAADQVQTGKTPDGYDYELWNQYAQGTATMQVGTGSTGSFTCSWTGIENVLFRTGKKLGSKQSYKGYNGIYLDYDVDYEPKGNSYMCVYGWTENPKTVEYYIVEAWGSWRPPGATNSLGTVEANGNKYDIYKTVRQNQPSIHGNETFDQYWSVRQNNPAQNNAKRHMEGRISISKHFEAWEKVGLDMGSMLYEVALNVEGYQSNGSASVNMNKIVMGEGDGDGGAVTPIEPIEPDSKGYYFNEDFENGAGDWAARGDTTLTSDTENYYNGKKSIHVTGRADTWQGAAIALDSRAFVAGNTYSFGAAVLQKNGATEEAKLTLQYNLNGEENYDTIASADAESGKWTKLENTAYTIPAGASNLLLYVETDSTNDFYIDTTMGAVSGTPSNIVTGGGTVSGVVTPTEPSTNPPATTKPSATTTKATSTAKPTEPTAPTMPAGVTLWGDANTDGVVDVGDAVRILQYLGNPDAFAMSKTGALNADVYENGGGITGMDAVAVLQLEAHLIDKLPIGEIASNPGTTPSTPDSQSDNYFSNSFDSSTDGWVKRGDASIALNSDSYYSGKSLLISGRTDYWHGASLELDTNAFKAGNTYSFSAAVMQKSGATEPMQMTLQYNLDGEEKYDQIVIADVKSGEWTKLENTSFTIPAGATNLLIYIEATNSLTDFYIDEVQGSAEGAKSSVITGGGVIGVGASSDNTGNTNAGSVDISWIDPSKPMVAISFDDGAVGNASTDTSMRIINALDKENFHATFFYVGDWIRNANGEAEVKYAYQKGMEIANHTTSHPDLSTKSASEIRSEYDKCASKLKGIIGAEPSKLLRLPYLASNATVTSTLSDVPMITCSVDTQDWNNASKDQIVSTIKNAMNNGSLNGSIVLCHETYSTTAAAMEELAPYLKSQGWQIVTISEMFAVKGKQLNGGQIYTKVN